jgi:hypothetical protein
MRRSIALLMIMIFGCFLSAPLLAASSDSESRLPACCRANGKHHCMMRMSHGELAGVQMAAPERCSYFPQWRPMNLSHQQASVSSAAVFYAALQTHPACHAQTEARRRVSFDRSRQKRGPPAPASAS